MPALAFMALLLLCAGLPALAVICLLPLGFALAFFVICLPFTAVAALMEPPSGYRATPKEHPAPFGDADPELARGADRFALGMLAVLFLLTLAAGH